jgi:hypothetical protein
LCISNPFLPFAPFVQVKKDEKSPVASAQAKSGLFKNFLNIDPRSPSTFISRTPITIFRSSSSAGKFSHRELNESLNETNESVDLDILTAAEQESLDSNKDLTESLKDEKLEDPRSPTEEIDRTPIVAAAENVEVKKDENNLIKKIADKLIMTKISNENDSKEQKTSAEITKKKLKEKNLIFEDDDENTDRFSTPPKKIAGLAENERTPLSSVGNNTSRRNLIKTSTPKSSKIPVAREIQLRTSASRIPRKI